MLGVLWRQEMRHLLRDRRALVAALVLPLLIFPLMLWSARFAERARSERAEEAPLQVAFTGAAAANVVELLPTPSSLEGWQRIVLEEPLTALAMGEIDLVVDGHWATPNATYAPLRTPRIQLLFRADYERSNRALQVLQEELSTARAEARSEMLESTGFGLEAAQILPTAELDVATAGQVAGSQIGRWVTTAILIFVLLGGSVVAGDTLAGEKERGTLETLLTSAVDRRHIVAAKWLAILTFGGLVAGVQLLNLYAHLTWGLIEVPSSFAVELPLDRLLLVGFLLLPLLVLSAGTLLWISGRASSYKEFHFYLLPVAVALLLPTTAAALPGASLDAGWALLPVANLSLAVRAVLSGHFAWTSVVLAWGMTAAVASWVVKSTLSELHSEAQLLSPLVQRDDLQLVPFERHIVGWFVAFWVFIFLALVHLPLLSGLIPQVLLNLVVVCLGGSWLLIQRYALPVREVLGLSTPSRVFWPLVLLGAPALVLANGAIYRWTLGLFPVPRRALESYGALFDSGQLHWAEIAAVAVVLPAICEEIAFRGVLLNGLRRRLATVQLCCVVGLAFAMFHFDLARFVPTMLLGAVLAALTLRSGSVYPAMVWHGLNNGLVLWLGGRGISIVELSSGWYVGGFAVFAACFVWLWRRPTPDGPLALG